MIAAVVISSDFGDPLMKIKAMFLWVFFVSMPSIVASGYVVYKIRSFLSMSYGFDVEENVYWAILFTTMWVTMYLTSKNVLKEFERKESPGESKNG